MLIIQLVGGKAFICDDNESRKREITQTNLQALLFENLDKQDVMLDERHAEACNEFLLEYEALCLRTNCHLMACDAKDGKLALGIVRNSEMTKQ
jgi:hypothetical protein